LSESARAGASSSCSGVVWPAEVDSLAQYVGAKRATRRRLQDPNKAVETPGVSNLDFFGTPVGDTVLSTPLTPTPAPTRRRPALFIAGALAVVAALVIGFVVLRPHPQGDRSVVVPDTLAGLPAAETALQFADRAGWRKTATETFGDTPLGGRAFGSLRPGFLVNLVVVRADSRGEADMALGRPPYTKIGQVSCTRTFQLPDGVLPGQEHPLPHLSESMLLCWRARDTLTVSAMVLAGPAGYEQAMARAVDEVWALNN
jgi:hypothetical protein